MPSNSRALELTKRFRIVLVAPALLLIALMCWSLSSPVGASPDDDFHLASIWCAQGDRGASCQTTPNSAERRVPKEILASPCYAFHAEISAGCQADIGAESGELVTTTRGNFTGLYPPVYYAAMSLFVMPDITVSVILMRFVNALVFVAFTTLLFILLPGSLRRTLVWSWVVSIVPLGVFLLASNNPSAWAIISGGTLWIALVGYFETSGRRKVALGVLASLAALMGAGSRADAAVFAILAVIVAVLLTMRRSRRYWLSALLPLGMILVSVLLYLSVGQSAVGANGFGDGQTVPDANGWRYYLWRNLLEVPFLWTGVFGSWNLGWLDTSLPSLVSVGSLVCFVGVAFSGLALHSRRKTAAVGLVLASLVAFPVYVLVKTNTTVGAEVQPRYLLPLIVLLGGVALLQVGRKALSFSPSQIYFIVGALTIANAVALHTNLRRYITGADVGGWNLDAQIEWWWNMPVSPMFIWIIGSASFGLFVLLAVTHVNRGAVTHVNRGAVTHVNRGAALVRRGDSIEQ